MSKPTPGSLARLLVKLIREQRPDLIAAEHTVPSFGQSHHWTTVSQEQLHGSLYAVAGLFNIRVVEPYPASIRKHVLGQGTAKKGQDIKALVIRRMQLLGYIPRDCFDNNRADACALFAYCEDVECRVIPKELVLFGT